MHNAAWLEPILSITYMHIIGQMSLDNKYLYQMPIHALQAYIGHAIL